MYSLSTLDRSFLINSLNNQHWDLLVIGGGITGAGILLDAVSRGMKVALIEKKDFAWGTSSRSTKLIHGGLRYLKQFEIGLVSEVGKERAIAHKNARHIVRPEKMLLPMYSGGSLNKLSGSIGLWVYDKVAGVKRSERRKMLSKAEVTKMEPLIKTEKLTGGGLYYEYRTDDARLTIEVIKTAVQRGALALNYAEAVKFNYSNDAKISGLSYKDNITEREYRITANRVINATGPWVDSLRMKDGENAQEKLFLSNGLHLVIARERLPIRQSMYFDVEGDNRMIFAIARGDAVYLGTTDVKFDGDIDQPEPKPAETQYILDAANSIFPSANLSVDDIISTWSGLRPLIYQEGKSASELSRKDEIFISDSGLVSIAGGKLTGYRKMAERAVNETLQLMPGNFEPSTTAEIQLSGCNVNSETAMESQIIDMTARGKRLNIEGSQIRSWHSRFGSNTYQILDLFESMHPSMPVDEAIIHAELEYCTQYELATTSEDFTLRRTAMDHFERDRLNHYINAIDKYYSTLSDKLQATFSS